MRHMYRRCMRKFLICFKFIGVSSVQAPHPFLVKAQSKLSDPAEGANARRGCPPVGVLPILSPFQQILAPSVVGEVVKHPDAIGHSAGIHLAQLVGVIHRGTIIRTFHHLSTEVRPLIQPQLPRVSIDLCTKQQFSLDSREIKIKKN